MNIGVCTIVDFKVIETIDDSNPYPSFLAIDSTFDNMAIINLKKRDDVWRKQYESNFSLGPTEGVRYTKPVKEEYCVADIDNVYQLPTKKHDFANPTAEGILSWDHDSSYASDLEEELYNW